MREPKLLGEVVRAAVRATKLPVTAKIRAGWDASSVNAAEVARICEGEGARAVAVHARTRDQFYAGRADWQVIAEVVRAVDIPVLGNGDVRTGADARRMLEETGCAHVMVGRAAQGDPGCSRRSAPPSRAGRGRRPPCRSACAPPCATWTWRSGSTAKKKMRKHVLTSPARLARRACASEVK